MFTTYISDVFLDNKYTKCYISIISLALQEKRIKLKKADSNFVYYEAHHIIPKSISPEYGSLKSNPWNKVLLTPKEHFICHLLLTKMCAGTYKNKMHYALWTMCNRQSSSQIRFRSNLYSAYKEKMQQSLSIDRKGKTFEELYGEERSAEIKERMKLRKTRSSPTETERLETSKRVSEYWKNNPNSAGFAKKPQLEKVVCEKCNMLVDPGNYAKHHGVNCKRLMKECPNCLTRFSTVPWENKKYCCRDCVKQAQHTSASADLT